MTGLQSRHGTRIDPAAGTGFLAASCVFGDGSGDGSQRWATRTVHGSRRFAQARLRELAEEAGYAHLRAGTLGDLLDRWYEAASPGWARTTVSHTRSVIDCYLKPHLGHLHVAKLKSMSM